MQPEPGPVAGRQQRDRDALRYRCAHLKVCVVEWMSQSRFVDICEIARQQFRIERSACRDFSGKAVAVGAAGVAILVGRDLRVPQELEEKGRIDAAVAVE